MGVNWHYHSKIKFCLWYGSEAGLDYYFVYHWFQIMKIQLDVFNFSNLPLVWTCISVCMFDTICLWKSFPCKYFLMRLMMHCVRPRVSLFAFLLYFHCSVGWFVCVWYYKHHTINHIEQYQLYHFWILNLTLVPTNPTTK